MKNIADNLLLSISASLVRELSLLAPPVYQPNAPNEQRGDAVLEGTLAVAAVLCYLVFQPDKHENVPAK